MIFIQYGRNGILYGFWERARLEKYMKFKGWYTNEKSVSNGNYMDANTQSIVQCWKKLEDFPKEELERFVPELFILEDDNIVINIL